MIEVITGDTVLLELVLADGDTTRFPQAEIYDSAGVAIVASPVNLSHVADGLYQGTFTAPAIGGYSIIYITYSDALHTTLVGNIERVSEHMRVTNAVQDDVWSEALPGAFAAGAAGNIVGTNVDATISSRSVLVQADILSDATPFPGADIDAAISSRSSHTAADVDALVTISHGAGSYQTATGFAVAGNNMGLTAAGVDAIWDEALAGHVVAGSTGKALDDASVGGSTPAAIAAAVWTEALPGAFGAGEAGKIVGDNVNATISSRSTLTQADILSDATPFAGALIPNLDATVSSRGTADPGDNMGATAAATAAIDVELTAAHGAGAWSGTSISQQDVRDAMKLAPSVGVPAVGSVDTHLDDIEADTAAMEPLVSANLDATVSSRSTLTQAQILSDLTPFPGADIDAAISTRSSHTAADVDALVTASHGAGLYQTATGFAVAGDNMGLTAVGIDGIWDEPIAGHLGAGTTGKALDDAGAGGSSPATIAAAVWSEPVPGAFAAGEAGKVVGDNINATISSRSILVQADIISDATPFAGLNVDAAVSSRGTANPGDAMTLTAGERTAIDTELSGTHGAGLWESDSDTDWTTNEKSQIRQALGVTGVTLATGAGELQDVLADTAVIEPIVSTNLDVAVSTRATPGDAMSIDAAGVDAIFDESLAGHLATGTAGQALAAAFGNAGGNVRDDALTYDANDRPLTLRRRIFPDAATANASTPGGVGEGELITVTMSAVQIDAAKWETLLRTI